MPAQQQGTVIKRGGKWQARWFAADGIRRQKNFDTKSEGRAFLKDEVDRVEKQRSGQVALDRPRTVDALCDLFLDKWGRTVDPATLRTVTANLKHLRKAFGTRNPASLRTMEFDDWREDVTEGVRHDVFRRARQMFTWCFERGLVDFDPTKGIKNPTRTKHERRPINPFESWAEVEAVAAEMDWRFRAILIVLVDTGMRPEELFGLDRADVDWDRCEFTVQRRWTQLTLKPGLKRRGESERVVPFTQRTVDAIKAMPPRIDTQVLFPAPQGGRINAAEFAHVHWVPAFRAAGVARRTMYDCRHTAISWALSAGVPPKSVTHIFGTSLKQLDATYSNLIKRDHEDWRAAMELYAARQAVSR
jgi:integrase